MNTPQILDYGEPWNQDQRVEMHIKDRSGNGIASFGASWNNIEDPEKLHKRQQGLRDRALACVNACAGMADPAAEIEDMREAIKEAYALVNDVYLEADSYADGATDAEFYAKLSNNFAHQLKPAITKLQPFIKP